jgi:hypothetical protein
VRAKPTKDIAQLRDETDEKIRTLLAEIEERQAEIAELRILSAGLHGQPVKEGDGVPLPPEQLPPSRRLRAA